MHPTIKDVIHSSCSVVIVPVLKLASCQTGLYRDDLGNCSTCPVGFYCPGGPDAIVCPAHSTTLSQGSSVSDCICLEGHYFASPSLFCQPCPRGQYKPEIGNGECALTCPTNADSELASTSLDDCFCMPEFHANMDENGQLATCIACTYSGMICQGGFVDPNATNMTATFPKVHSQPFAGPGFYQTGRTSAVECNILLLDGSSVCQGGSPCLAQRLGLPAPEACHGTFGNACVEGSTGVACGECARDWSRDKYPEPCGQCQKESASLLAVEILLDLLVRAFLGFVVAALAASSAVKGNSKLHISMIRIGSQWLAACSVITQFNLQRLPAFDWVQRQQRIDALEACAASNSTSTCDVGSAVIKFPWPPEFSDALRDIFAIMGVVPKLVSVEFTMQCHAEDLISHDRGAKVMAPALYYVLSPVIALLGVFFVCALLVYCVVPCGRAAGIHFNNVSKEKNKKEKAMAKIKKSLIFHLAKHGLTWQDIEDSEILEEQHATTLIHAAVEPQQFIVGTISKCKPLAAQMCWHCLQSDSLAASSWSAVRMSFEEFLENPDFLLKDIGDEDQSLAMAALGEIPGDLLETFVHRALAWKLAGKVESHFPQDRVAEAVIAASASSANLFEQSARERTWNVVVKSICLRLRDEVEVEAQAMSKTQGEAAYELDPATLDFGLFTSRPGFVELLVLCIPVFWVTLLAMWPELLRAFLQMVWCASISGEDADGRIVVQQRLLPHPDVVCWSRDHFASLLIACIGLGLWCTAVPLTLFWRIYRLKDRQSAENMRKYGYFCEGYEPRYWWWDILVKRADIGLMNIVTYTSIASDGKAKLLLFPFVSGCMLAIAAWYQPFANTQAEILDFLEMCLLSFRFFLFSTISVLLIFNPAEEMMWALACTLATMLASFCTYFGLHIVVQILRASVKLEESDDSDSEWKQMQGLEKKAKKKSRLKRLAGTLKKKFVGVTTVLFQERDDERVIVEWSVGSESFALVSAAQSEGKPGKEGGLQRVVSAVRDTRSKIFRFGLTFQRKTVIKAFEEFTELWLDDFNQKSLPADAIQVMCALTTASRHVPSQVPKQHLAQKWKAKVVDILHQVEGRRTSKTAQGPRAMTWRIVPDDFLEMTARLSKLSPEEAAWLVSSTQAAMHNHRMRFAETQIIREDIMAQEVLGDANEGVEGVEGDGDERSPIGPSEEMQALTMTTEKAVQTSLTSAKKKTQGSLKEVAQQSEIPKVEGIVPRIPSEDDEMSY